MTMTTTAPTVNPTVNPTVDPAEIITAEDMRQMLLDPFPASEIRWKPQAVTKDGAKALAIAYIDARRVMDRLDDVFGLGGWTDRYELLEGKQVICWLSVFVNGQWITRQDVGGESDQNDEGDRLKSAYSDALKRAAVKFGIGRYLYRLGGEWVPFDAKTKTLAKTPVLPPWALPGGKPARAGKQIDPEAPNGEKSYLKCLHSLSSADNKDKLELYAKVFRDRQFPAASVDKLEAAYRQRAAELIILRPVAR